ncbi:MAG: hypothetical protein ABIT71_03820 [Vicinamibacteraceae bacterium]
MSQQDDRPEDAATEWLSPALYRQLCDAVDAALFAPPDAREALLAARLGSDQRLLAEARALLASHEESPRTFISPAPNVGGDETFVGRRSSPNAGGDETFVGRPSPGGGGDETFVGRPSPSGGGDETFVGRRDSATVIVPGSGSHRTYPHEPVESDGTQEMRALSGPPGSGTRPGADSGSRSGSGTVTLRSPMADPSPTADTSPRVPIAQESPASSGTRPAWGPPVPINQPPPPMPAAPPPMPPMPAAAAPPAPPPIARPVQAAPVPPSAPEPPPAPVPSPAPAAKPVRGSDVGAPIPTRRSGGSAAGVIGLVTAGLLLLVAGGALWMWRQANVAQQAAEARLAKAEKRFTEVRQLGQRLAEVDHLLAVTSDTGAQAARAVLLRTWMQYLTDLQRASGSTERELLTEVAKGYRQLAASLGGVSGRTLGDRAGATRTLQIAENLWSYLDRNSPQPDAMVRQELIATHVDLGDLYAVGKDAGKASAQYQKALAAAGTLSTAGLGATDVKRITDMVRQRIQSGPPTSAPPVVDATPVTASQEP